MADTEPKTDEVLEQKQEDATVESTETPEASNDEPTSGDANANGDKADEAEANADDEEADDSFSRYHYRRDLPKNDAPRYEGVVRWFGKDRNYGFIEVKSEEKGNPDAHVHGDNVELDSEGNIQILEEGQECTFTLLERPPPKSDPTGETKYTAKNVIPGKKQKKEKKVVKKYKGRCVFFNFAKDKKFGFIKIDACDDYPTGVEVFVHQDSIIGAKGKGLVEDQPVEECELVSSTSVNANGEETTRLRAIKVKPGKAPPEDPEKDKVFTGTVVRWVERKEKEGGKEVDKSFGFIRLDSDSTREVMVHNSRISSGNKVLVVTQKCKFKIQKRKDRNDPKAALRESATDVVPGDVPVKKVLTGVVRFFDVEKGFGFIQRKGQQDQDYYCRVEAIIGPDKVLEENQTVTFVAAPSNRPGKPRATDIKPGPKAVDGKVAELAPEETPFEAYLPAHTEAVKKKAKKKSNLPNHIQIQQDETLTEAEKEAALKKDFNYRKRMRRKRAQAREDSPEKKAAPAPKREPSPPVIESRPEPTPAPQQSSSSKKKKSKAKAQQPPQPQQEQPKPKQKKQQQQQQQQQQPQQAAPAQTNSKKKKKASSSSGDNQEQQKKQQQQQQQQQQPLQTNKKKPKRKNKNGASKRKAKADKQQQDEDDAIDALFEANRKSHAKNKAAEEGLFSIIYNYILSFCKAPAPKRKLKY